VLHLNDGTHPAQAKRKYKGIIIGIGQKDFCDGSPSLKSNLSAIGQIVNHFDDSFFWKILKLYIRVRWKALHPKPSPPDILRMLRTALFVRSSGTTGTQNF
jgi:hypothetical protein